MREDISHERKSNGMKREEAAGDIRTISVSTNSKTCTFKESEIGKGLLHSNVLFDSLRCSLTRWGLLI